MIDISQIITIICTALASTGLWNYLQKKDDKKNADSELLLGLAHERILALGQFYLTRVDENGEHYITAEEYENLYDYLYLPYKKRGGNGSAERIVKECAKLPIRSSVAH